VKFSKDKGYSAKLYILFIIKFGAKTIQLKEETYRMLQKIKEIKKAKTFDEVVRDLVLKELGVEPEMFGVDKGKIKPYTPGDRMEDRSWQYMILMPG
jgi:predicted CopG family antitoxin